MLGEAIGHLSHVPQDADARADVFEGMAAQIERHSGGAWSATRGTGDDGAHIFLGRQGDGLVIAPDGRVYRGAIGRGIAITATGLHPDYGSLRLLV
jgi:hypothetical protein